MRKLVAKKDSYMKEGALFLIQGKEYEVADESNNSLMVHSEISDQHFFDKQKESDTYFGKYFVTEEDLPSKEKETVEEVAKPATPAKQNRQTNQSKKQK